MTINQLFISKTPLINMTTAVHTDGFHMSYWRKGELTAAWAPDEQQTNHASLLQLCDLQLITVTLYTVCLSNHLKACVAQKGEIHD